jgi:hypothetical protein
MTAKFDKIEALLAAPSSASWDALCEELDHIDDVEQLAQMLNRLDVALASWPDDIRICPLAWCNAASASKQRIARLKIFYDLEIQFPGLDHQDPDQEYLHLQCLAHDQQSSLLVFAMSDYRQCWIGVDDLNLGRRRFVYPCMGEASNVLDMRCNSLQFFGGGRGLMAVVAASTREGLPTASILLYWDGEMRTKIDAPLGTDKWPARHFAEAVAEIDEVGQRIYYWFSAEKRLVAFDLLHHSELFSLTFEDADLGAIHTTANGELWVGLEWGESYRINVENASTDLKGPLDEGMDLPAYAVGRSGDASIFCTVHPYTEQAVARGYENRLRYGGMLFWQWDGNQPATLSQEIPFESAERLIAAQPAAIKIIEHVHDVHVYHVYRSNGTVVPNAPEVVHAVMTSHSGLCQRLRFQTSPSTYPPCLNGFDRSEIVLIGYGKQIYEWLPSTEPVV